MDNSRFEEIKANMGSSIKMKLDTIWKSLHDNKAACLVGAGFSKNAEMDEFTTMKDWPELGVEFYKSLYGEDFSCEDLIFSSVLRLASQVEAAKGRAELESLIQHSLPNERVFPGRLHIDLMKLPWNDVFTTNYDTLLEKAFIEADRYYYTVTNKETLLYTPHPRIIKLHGSFPDIRPFIITEEDFRTYPQHFPEFVNTVRQSLIENVLCLIGFSGDDPNFMSWLGWLRDVMGKQSSPVYQITYDTHMHDSDVMLSYEMGITKVNLADISGLKGYTDALDFFMHYLSQEYNTEWKGSIKSDFIEQKDHAKVVGLIKDMKRVRDTYPGWYLLPPQYIENFNDLKSDFPFYSNMYKNAELTPEEQVEFLYEIDWRLRISFSSSEVEWYCNAIKGLVDFQTDNTRLIKKINRLLLSLLEHYRTVQDTANYQNLYSVLDEKRSEMTYEQQTFFTYQQCLHDVSVLNYGDVNRILNVWNLRSMDYKGALWKSCILFEVGRKQECESLLKEMLKTVKRNILSTSYSEQLMSAKSALEYRIWYMDIIRNARPVKNNNFDIYKLFDQCRELISKFESRPAEFSHTHDFNLLATGKQWNSGESGFQSDYFGSFRYFKIYEAIGIPVGDVNGISMEIKTKQNVLNILARYNMGYALSLLIRCGDNGAMKYVLNRRTLLQISREATNSFYNRVIETCKKGIQIDTPAELRIRILSVLLPALTRFSVKLDPEKNKELFKMWMSVYIDYDRYYDPAMITTLYMNTTGQSLIDCEQLALEAPIKDSDMVKDMVMPQWNLRSVIVSQKAYEVFVESINSESKSVSNKAYSRLGVLYQCALSEIQRHMIDSMVGLWRVQRPLTTQKLFSLHIVKPEQNAHDIYEALIREELENFCNNPFKNDHSSVFITNFEDGLQRLSALYLYMTMDDHIRFVNRIVAFLNDNEEFFKNDDSREFMGGFHSFVEGVFCLIRAYTSTETLPSLSPESEIWHSLYQVLLRYKKYNYPVMTSIAHLSFLGKYDKTKLKNLVTTAILSDRDEIVDDAEYAFIFMAKKQGRRLNQALLKQIISYITHSLNEKTASYIAMLAQILYYDGISKEAMSLLIAYMDAFVYQKDAFNVQEELKAEVMYRANILAGAMSVLVPAWAGVDTWKEKMSSEMVFNDVKVGFEIGVEMAQKI